MYQPGHFVEDRLPVLHEAMRNARLASIVTLGAAGIEASHVPLLLETEPAPYGTLVGHLARPNPQWTRIDANVQALAIFMGPEAYVTPSWYPTKRESGKVVPTWNYVAIHAYGRLRFFDDADSLLDVVTRLTAAHEGRRAEGGVEPWAVSDAPADFIQGMLRGIVGFALTIERLEGKWKMSQNRPMADRAGVVAGLNAEGGPREAEVAAIVKERTERVE